MKASYFIRAGVAAALCLATAVPIASAAEKQPAYPTVVSVEGEARPDLPKDTAALSASSIPLPAEALVDATYSASGDVAPTDVAPTSVAPTSGNSLPIGDFKDGDIILGFNTWSVGHCGILDGTRNIALTTSCVWSAVKESPGCVVLERPSKYRGYDFAYGLWVPRALASQRTSARRFCSSQIGERYNLFSAKSDYTQWYCSKLPWAGYRDRAMRDLDANGGYWVTPADVYNDNDTSVFASAQ
ncbi:MAG: hypothetical protein KJ747_07705 [Actinobacteria bacterium]|nr:hypothetical protein [Actinomycetota bacterium]